MPSVRCEAPAGTSAQPAKSPLAILVLGATPTLADVGRCNGALHAGDASLLGAGTGETQNRGEAPERLSYATPDQKRQELAEDAHPALASANCSTAEATLKRNAPSR